MTATWQEKRDSRYDRVSLAQYERTVARQKYERDLRLAERDRRYRDLLGVSALAPLPKALGTAGGTRSGYRSGLRGTKRPA